MRNDDAKVFADMRVAVLGSTGFIGRWVARELSRAGARLYLPVRDRARAEPILAEFDVDGDISELDLCDRSSLKRFFREAAPTVTFNLAGYGVNRTEKDEKEAFRTNAEMVYEVCESIGSSIDSSWAGLDIVHVGSAQEYGSAVGDLNEETVPKPTTAYGLSKLEGTNILLDRCRSLGIKGVTARLFTVYGPGEKWPRLLPTLMNAASTTSQIPLTEGLQQRDFTYVEDVAVGMLKLAALPAASGQIVNLATGKLTSVRSFAECAADALGISHQRLDFGSVPTRNDEMSHESVCIDKLKDLTSWAPETTLPEGVKRTLSFFGSDCGASAARPINNKEAVLCK